MKTVILNHNRIENYPVDLSVTLPNVTEVYLKGNLIKSLTLQKLEKSFNIRILDLSDNHIQRIESGIFYNSSSLLKLDLSYNRLTRLSPQAFKGLDRLKWININQNQLATVPTEIFTPLYSLQTLLFASNRLQKVTDWFLKCKNINIINLQENLIQHISSKAFNNLKHITLIDLKDNKINKFPSTFLKESVINGRVNMENNPLSCECYLVSLELKTLMSTNKINGKCNSPAGFKGRQIASLTRKELECMSCDFNECKNNATCVIRKNYYQCLCHPKFYGKFCENKEEVKSKLLIGIIIPVCVCVLLGVAALIYYKCKKHCSKTQCCCCCFLFLVFCFIALFFTLRIVSYMYQE